MEFMRKRATYTGQSYKANEEILSDLKINPVIKKIRNYINKWIQHVRRTDRQTATLNNEISTTWETKPRTTHQKNSQLLKDWNGSLGLNPASYMMIMKYNFL
jgi:hypothetical protein